MGKGNKLKKQVNNSKPAVKNDSYDVKSNLKKLNTGNGRDSHSSTNYDYLGSDKSEGNKYSNETETFSQGFQTTAFDKFENLNNKINTDISGVKDLLNGAKEKIDAKISSEISKVKSDCEGKLNEKVDNKYFYGAVTILVVITTLIGALSYFPLISDFKSLEDKNDVIMDSINKMNIRIEKLK